VRGGGLLIAFEGIDGTGKSTQVERLRRWLVSRHPERVVRSLREPGGTPFGEQVRALLLHGGPIQPLTETLLYQASRAELYALEVLPSLARGEWLLCDRTHYSTAAYQGAGLQLGEDWVLDLGRRAVAGREADRIVLLDMEAAAASARCASGAGAARGDRVERRGLAYFERVRQAYLRHAAADPARWLVVDAGGSEEAVTQRVLAGLEGCFDG